MFLEIEAREKSELQITPVKSPEAVIGSDDDMAAQKAELRRQMYARIARGNALAEAEENAYREWKR